MGVWAMTHLTSLASEKLFRELGGMHPSRTTVDRLPKGISERWAMRRREWESELQAQEEAVSEVAVIGVSLDGVMAPMKDGQREAKREQSLRSAFDLIYGADSAQVRAKSEAYRQVLLNDDQGAEKVIRTLAYHHRRKPRRDTLKKELTYLRRNRSRMKYAQLHAQNLPIGSGIIEAACKTLVTQRMKRSAQRWTINGGQAILTFRALVQSDRFDAAWTLVVA